ncbi:hypothetical protein NQ314_002551 [Rhamnusium bicolor]|uniref:Peptidase C1A papain C-terminal domain-containing protein n=1 Tax=Rhamnusium bicolor TaxID=1586634 RepID=A0AAV8ZP51_9CUCU|nr:hypothetical protein NQ314_002551 [Rhamnusium bicolor]
MRLFYLVLIFLHLTLASKKFTTFSDEYIEHINSQQLTWKARKNFDEGTSIRNLLGSLPDKARSALNIISYADDNTEIPETFDAREKWPDCKSLNEIRDQSNCGSCWAFAAVEAMTDRICIHSNGKKNTSVSAEDLLSCCDICGDGCEGGYPAAAWQYWYETGIVSGGSYKSKDDAKETVVCRRSGLHCSIMCGFCTDHVSSSRLVDIDEESEDEFHQQAEEELDSHYGFSRCKHRRIIETNEIIMGCRSYSLTPCEHHVDGNLPGCNTLDEFSTPNCVKNCDAETNLNYTLEITYGNKPYAISSVERDIQIEILNNGPVEASFDVFDDFLTYSEGVYQRTEDAKPEGGHAVKIIGWGVEKNTPYWLIANSWNDEWGEKGYFKMLRGVNHCGIESNIVAGLPVNGASISKFQTIIALLSAILFYIFH